MSDLGASTWSEIDASNNAAVPNGWPEGMQPSGVNNSARSNMGGEKRFWNRINAVKTTAGTTANYTLTYDQAAAAYYDGELFTFIVHATNAAAPDLNINGLGARQITLFGGNLLAGALITNQVVTVRYKLSDTTFEIIPQHGWVRLGSQDPSAASSVDFSGVPAGVNNLMFTFEGVVGTDAVDIGLRTYGADGIVDSGGSDYSWWVTQVTSATLVVTAGGAAGSYISLGTGVDNGAVGFHVVGQANNIQNTATQTKLTYQSNYLNSGGVNGIGFAGYGLRVEAARITGIQLLPSSGTFTGRAELFASA